MDNNERQPYFFHNGNSNDRQYQEKEQEQAKDELDSYIFQLESEMDLMTWAIGLVSTKSAFLFEWRKKQKEKEEQMKEIDSHMYSSQSSCSAFTVQQEIFLKDQYKAKKFCADEETFLLWQCGRLLLLEKVYEYGFFEGLKLFQNILLKLEEEYDVMLPFPVAFEKAK